jgi:uncharacterized membrane protein
MPEGNNRRYELIDAIRGLTLISMVLYHFTYDVFVIYGRAPRWPTLPAVHLWQQSICWTFIFLSGFVWTWGREGNLRRGLLINGCGLLISLVTRFLLPSQVIWFGVLNLIGCAILLMIPLEKAVGKIPAVPGAAVSFFLFLVCRPLRLGYLGLDGLFRVDMPRLLYDIRVLTPLGFPFPGFRSSDFFPLLPWMLLYLTGYFASRALMGADCVRRAAGVRVPGLSAVGKKTLWVYLAHQPVLMGICTVLFG